MDFSPEKPLITFALFAYKQERFIREAIEGAFAQTYSPLEIFLSDDCSPDLTFKIMKEMAAKYHGPHQILLNRNEKNLGIGGHVNRIMEMVKGDFIVVAAGDDISLPNRVETIYEVWTKSGKKATSIFSSYIITSMDGKIDKVGGLREIANDNGTFARLDGDLFNFLSRKKPVVNGCTHAWSPLLFSYFGPLQSDLEDLVLSFRTLAIGQMFYIHEPLVKYRRHGENLSFLAERDDTYSFEHRERRLRIVDEKSVAAWKNLVYDIEKHFCRGEISEKYRDHLKAEAQKKITFYKWEKQIMDGSFFRRLLILASMLVQGELRLTLRFSVRALPRSIYKKLYILRDRLQAIR